MTPHLNRRAINAPWTFRHSRALFGLACWLSALLLLAGPSALAGQTAPPERQYAVSDKVAELGAEFKKWNPRRGTATWGKRVSDKVRKVRFDRHGPVIIVTVHDTRFANGTRVQWSEWPGDGRARVVVDQIDITSSKVDGGGGLRVGSSMQDVEARYGPPIDAAAPVWVYSHSREYVDVAFHMAGGRVSKIVWSWPGDPAD